MDLDALFGPCRAPASIVQAHELRAMPLSRVELKTDTVAGIAEFLDDSEGKMTSVFAIFYHLLWIMDCDGRVFIAVEEQLDADDRTIAALPLMIRARPSGAIKLGHPSLIDSATRNARIGGEIVYDPEWDPGKKWVLTNKSGRYGLRNWQTEDHLREAHGFFTAAGLHLGMRFISPRG